MGTFQQLTVLGFFGKGFGRFEVKL